MPGISVLNLHRQQRLALALLVAALIASAMPLARPAGAVAATITVNTTADELNEDGDCSLREALRAANRDQPVDACPAGRGADLIALPPGLFRLTRGGSDEDEGRSGDLDILRDLTLRGAGADRTVIVAAFPDRVFDVFAPATVTLEGLALRGGAVAGGLGGCVRNFADLTLTDVRVEGCSAGRAGGLASLGSASRLTLIRSVVASNVAFENGSPGAAGGLGSEGELMLVDSQVIGNSGSFGAGIYSAGPARILRSAVAGNSATSPFESGPGLGGGIYNGGDMAIESSTISRNRAAGGGAGIYSPGALRVRDSTIAFNESFSPADPLAAAAGIWAPGAATLRGSIVAANREDGILDDCAGLISLGANLTQSLCGLAGPGDLSGVDPLLGPLRNNGGYALSHALLEGSPAIDAGFGCEVSDQRGISRPLGAACDIGAIEREDARAPFAATLRDEFGLSGERISSDWAGLGRPGYSVVGGQLVPGEGGPIYWVRDLLGQSQAAAITLRSIDRSGSAVHGLLLKVRRYRGRATWHAGAIRVAVAGQPTEVRIEAYIPSTGWRLVRAFPAALFPGDTLGARAFADGSVAAYLNGNLLGVADTRDLPGAEELFVGGEGYAGLWFERAPGALADDFAAQ